MPTETKSKIVTPGELVPGMYVTILEHHEREEMVQTPFGPVAHKHKPTAGIGSLLHIKAVDLPFVVLQEKMILDTRGVVLMELSEEFVRAATS